VFIYFRLESLEVLVLVIQLCWKNKLKKKLTLHLARWPVLVWVMVQYFILFWWWWH